ncbi:hypothetical protein G3I60_03820 [Streptomyces sp. SID13666]|uniref:hypothetical protein n=1 Tax=unclassified Streptomyces TaxID=2593676 RepID=UPI0013C12AC5|nr:MULTISPECIES: hypothetical protein [unclassified Streptomyces]NEA53318.1 hypothetical protein [Streptomyces sp. SID13666]NEA69355.1 hypothetical protein [Streptomyces sp. SID13588]
MISLEGAEVVASGGSYLRAGFELVDWAATTVFDGVGAFRFHLVPDADRSLLDGFLELPAPAPSAPEPSCPVGPGAACVGRSGGRWPAVVLHPAAG